MKPTRYKITGYINAIKPVHYRSEQDSNHAIYFDTFEEAHSYLIGRMENEIASLEAKINRLGVRLRIIRQQVAP